jgi:hypothetical protein
VAIAGMAAFGTASAAPAGAAANLSIASQACQANGKVTATLRWQPSGLGSQFVQLANSASFSNYSTGGPYASNANTVNLTQLKQGSTYYARVLTSSGGGTLVSDTIAVTARGCAPGDSISPPRNLSAVPLNNGNVQLDWSPGNNNIWYCVDTAPTLNALYNLGAGWRNHGCWTTNSHLTISGLNCGTTYYWLVYTWNHTGNAKSDPSTFQTRACEPGFTPPHNLQISDITETSARISWQRGVANDFFCVDVAKELNHLFTYSASFRNYGCGSTGTTLVAGGLDCDTQYFVRVWAWRPNVASGYSQVVDFKTDACEVTFSNPSDVDVFQILTTSARVEWEAGVGNLFFCVDVAETQNDLTSFDDTFQNYHCGTMATDVLIGTPGAGGFDAAPPALTCDTDYFLRVFSWRPGVGSGYSPIVTFTTDPCP